MRTRYCIYLTEADERILRRLSSERNQSRSAVIRKLLQTNKYIENLKEIEANNRIISGYLKEFTHIGTNINQIAYHLNADIIRHGEAKTDLEKSMVNLIKKMEELNERIETLKIEIEVPHFKSIGQEESSGEEEIKGEENG
ncbi:plasmid mobilization relaxosome protein MobC [Campylobacter fetus subsp. venerealis]|nr:plasmid mobilization relaxosome protein MobC [Campylobacter fetus subsp. venerealis]MBK3502201.1 plasmid mobilization relaxosome protein MobC [Campylobacter fetus subsp. venerealis]OCS16954.1 hypothetical protein CfvWBT01109_01845 [Campylobacter fetus subsp. venerealis]